MITTTIDLDDIKNHGWYELGTELGLSDNDSSSYFEYGEYASITIEVDEDLNIVGGKIHRKS